MSDGAAAAESSANSHPRQKRRRGLVWGARPVFQIAPVHAGSRLVATGWGVICERGADRPGLQGKNAMSNSGL